MKALTLNTHSWVELHQIPKIKKLAQFIAENDIDVVLLQEVNQHQETRPVDELPTYLPATKRAVHHDNYAQILVEFLADMDAPYFWSWVDSHQGWEAYDEGVAVLARQKPLRVEPVIMDDGVHGYDKVWRRTALAAEVQINNQSVWFASTHMNWWHKEGLDLFEKDFVHLNAQLQEFAGDSPIVLAGDFNNGCEIRNEGYDQVVSLGWHDAFLSTKSNKGEFTVHKEIAGWEGSVQAMRIDFFFTSTPIEADHYEIVFKDHTPEAISDHSGVLLEFDENQLFA